MRTVVCVALFVVVLLTLIPASAQSPEKYSQCEFDPTFAAIQTEFTSVSDWESLEVFNDALDSSMAFCMGLYWTGDGVQDSTVIGPFIIPAGTYRFVVTTEGYINALFEWTDEDCDDLDFRGAFVTEGQAVNGSEVLYRKEMDCEVFMTVSNVRFPWTVEFRPIQ